MKLLSIFVALTIMAACQAINVRYKDCGSQVGVINSVSVEPCDKDPCVLQKGKNYTIGVTFTSAEATSMLHAKVYGVVLGVKVAFPLPQPNGCMDSGITCPVAKGQQYTYKATLPIATSYPSLKVVVEWDLMDHDTAGNKMFCSQFLVAIA